MAKIDGQAFFSDAQAVTVTAASTNSHNLINTTPQLAGGADCFVEVRVDTAFAGGTSITASLQTDSDGAFGSATTVTTGSTVLTASATAGASLLRFNLKGATLEQYIRVYYTVVGTMSAGKVDAYLVETPVSRESAVS